MKSWTLGTNELHILFASQRLRAGLVFIVVRIKLGSHIATRVIHLWIRKVLHWQPVGQRQLGRPKLCWESKLEMHCRYHGLVTSFGINFSMHVYVLAADEHAPYVKFSVPAGPTDWLSTTFITIINITSMITIIIISRKCAGCILTVCGAKWPRCTLTAFGSENCNSAIEKWERWRRGWVDSGIAGEP